MKTIEFLSTIGAVKFIALLLFIAVMVITRENANYLWFLALLPVIAIWDWFEKLFVLEYISGKKGEKNGRED